MAFELISSLIRYKCFWTSNSDSHCPTWLPTWIFMNKNGSTNVDPLGFNCDLNVLSDLNALGRWAASWGSEPQLLVNFNLFRASISEPRGYGLFPCFTSFCLLCWLRVSSVYLFFIMRSSLIFWFQYFLCCWRSKRTSELQSVRNRDNGYVTMKRHGELWYYS